MQQLITFFHVLVAIALIALILMQKGRGSAAGAAFGSGSSNTMFGSQGATPFLVKVIAGLALLFFLTSLTLGYLTGKAAKAAANNPLIPISTQIPK
jgi:preprotein translocase subunit SecG